MVKSVIYLRMSVPLLLPVPTQPCLYDSHPMGICRVLTVQGLYRYQSPHPLKLLCFPVLLGKCSTTKLLGFILLSWPQSLGPLASEPGVTDMTPYILNDL